jgi:quercetin dioxygenase-like cupin family protein
VPIEVRRFGVGHRRPDGPKGTVGIEGQVIVSGATGVIAELAFGRRAHVVPHASPNATWFVVIEGGGWVGVDEERTRVTAGEAVLWPANIPHAAWTEETPMRAIVVELPEPALALPLGVVDAAASPVPGRPARAVSKGVGGLVPGRRARSRAEDDQGEPD